MYHLNLYSLPTKRNKNAKKINSGQVESTSKSIRKDSLSKSEEESVRIELVRHGWMVFMDVAQLKTSEDLMINLPMMPWDMDRLKNTGPSEYFYWGEKSFIRLY